MDKSATQAWATDIAGMPVDVAEARLDGTTPAPIQSFKPFDHSQRPTETESVDWRTNMPIPK